MKFAISFLPRTEIPMIRATASRVSLKSTNGSHLKACSCYRRQCSPKATAVRSLYGHGRIRRCEVRTRVPQRRVPQRVNDVERTRSLCAVTGIARLLIWVQTHSMEYRDIRYTIRVRIEPEQWSVAIHPGGVEMAGKTITGTREHATSRARSMIDKWLEKHPGQQR